jgi:hypothetical protein
MGGPGRALSSPARSHLAPGSPLPLNSAETNGPPPGRRPEHPEFGLFFEIAYPPRRNPRIAGAADYFRSATRAIRSAQVSGMAGTRGVNWQRLRPQSAVSGRLSADHQPRAADVASASSRSNMKGFGTASAIWKPQETFSKKS